MNEELDYKHCTDCSILLPDSEKDHHGQCDSTLCYDCYQKNRETVVESTLGRIQIERTLHGEIVMNKIDDNGYFIKTIGSWNNADSKKLIKKAGGGSNKKIVDYIEKHGVVFDDTTKNNTEIQKYPKTSGMKSNQESDIKRINKKIAEIDKLLEKEKREDWISYWNDEKKELNAELDKMKGNQEKNEQNIIYSILGTLLVKFLPDGEIAIDELGVHRQVIGTLAMWNKADSDQLIKNAGGRSAKKIVDYIEKHSIHFDPQTKY